MTRDLAAMYVRRLFAAWPNVTLTKAVGTEWVERIQPLDEPDVLAAIERITSQAEQRPPTLGAFLAECRSQARRSNTYTPPEPVGVPVSKERAKELIDQMRSTLKSARNL